MQQNWKKYNCCLQLVLECKLLVEEYKVLEQVRLVAPTICSLCFGGLLYPVLVLRFRSWQHALNFCSVAGWQRGLLTHGCWMSQDIQASQPVFAFPA